MGLFDRKYCDICGEKIGLLGNRKLEDGNLCKNCAKKLSPWFSDRRSSTVAEIREQLAWREANRERAAKFRATRSYGERAKLLLDETHRWFTVTRAVKPADDNSDVLDFSSITGCRMDIDERRTELKLETKDREGKTIHKSYTPPRYEYDYDFDIILSVNVPYFNEMRFQLNSSPVHIPYQPTITIRSGSRIAQSIHQEPLDDPQYRSYKETCQEICNLIGYLQNKESASMPNANSGFDASNAAPSLSVEEQEVLKNVTWSCDVCHWPNPGTTVCQHCGAPFRDEKILTQVRTIVSAKHAMKSSGQSWSCPFCGATNLGSFCASCGAQKPEQTAPCRCSRCGWQLSGASPIPKFCPECGQPF